MSVICVILIIVLFDKHVLEMVIVQLQKRDASTMWCNNQRWVLRRFLLSIYKFEFLRGYCTLDYGNKKLGKISETSPGGKFKLIKTFLCISIKVNTDDVNSVLE